MPKSKIQGKTVAEPLLAWSETLALGQNIMDDTHREFVEQLNRVGTATDAGVLAALDVFIRHTQAHFTQEEVWMEKLQFAPLGCHRGEHEKILETTLEVRKRVAAGDVELGRKLAEALAEWFPQHALSMDAMLAMHIVQTGFEPEPLA